MLNRLRFRLLKHRNGRDVPSRIAIQRELKALEAHFPLRICEMPQYLNLVRTEHVLQAREKKITYCVPQIKHVQWSLTDV